MTSTSEASSQLAQLLRAAIQLGASDVHLKAGAAPMFRIDGDLRPVEAPATAAAELDGICIQLIGTSAADLASMLHHEFSYEWPGVGRFRGHFYRSRGKSTLALRPIPLKIPSMNELRLPLASRKACGLTQGLVLVSGATGMGKSTTLASLVDTIAHTTCRHIVTIEDPIEYVFEDGMSQVTQREVGRDVESFDEGLRQALRQDPDVLLIGEARDRETMEVALHAAESGHLVLTSAHFSDVQSAVNGIIGMADAKEQTNWRFRLADAMRVVIAQRLLPRRGGSGRVLASEVLVADPSIRSCIQDEARMKNLRAALERGKGDLQTHTLDQSLLELLQARLITLEVAQASAISPGELMREITLRRIAV